MASFDVIILGAGPGGYVCAIRCAQLGLKVAVVEGRETLGGTCLNIGCIPSKALLHASHMLHETHENFEKMGLMGGKPTVDWARMLGYKDDVVGQNTKGIEFLFKKNKVTWIKGWGSIPAPGQVKVGDEVHEAKNIVIATGSEPSTLPGVTVDEMQIVTSTGALALAGIPKSMAVIGGGVIGLELGSVYARLGTEVTVVEYLDAITPGMDAEVAKSFQRILAKQGLKFILGAAVQSAEKSKSGVTLRYKLPQGRQRGDASPPTSSSSRPAASPTPPVWASRRWGSRCCPAARSRSTAISPPISRASTPSATPSPAPCSPTRPRMRGWPWPRFWPARRAT